MYTCPARTYCGSTSSSVDTLHLPRLECWFILIMFLELEAAVIIRNDIAGDDATVALLMIAKRDIESDQRGCDTVADTHRRSLNRSYK